MDFKSNSSGSVVIYDGTTDPKEFVRQFQLQAMFSDWDDAKQLVCLPLFLKGKAMRMYDSITTKTKPADILSELSKKCAQPKELLLYQFYRRERSAGETITKYALALQDLLVQAVPEMSTDQQLILLRAQLCLSVPEHMRALIQFNSALGWDELLSCLDKSLPHVNAHANEINQASQYTVLIINLDSLLI